MTKVVKKCDGSRPKTLWGKIIYRIKLWQVKRILKGGYDGK